MCYFNLLHSVVLRCSFLLAEVLSQRLGAALEDAQSQSLGRSGSWTFFSLLQPRLFCAVARRVVAVALVAVCRLRTVSSYKYLRCKVCRARIPKRRPSRGH